MSWTFRWRYADFSSPSATLVDPAYGEASSPERPELRRCVEMSPITGRRGLHARKALPRNVNQTPISYLLIYKAALWHSMHEVAVACFLSPARRRSSRHVWHGRTVWLHSCGPPR